MWVLHPASKKQAHELKNKSIILGNLRCQDQHTWARSCGSSHPHSSRHSASVAVYYTGLGSACQNGGGSLEHGPHAVTALRRDNMSEILNLKQSLAKQEQANPCQPPSGRGQVLARQAIVGQTFERDRISGHPAH